MFNWRQYFTKRPCHEALDWIKENGLETMSEAWQKCERSDWMIWALEHHRYGLTKLQRVEIAVQMVRETPIGDGRTVYDLLTDKRSIHAIEVAERYVAGEASEEELREAARAASAARAACAAASKAAAWAAEWAADAAVDAAAGAAAEWTAEWAADAAASVADEAVRAAADTAAARKAQSDTIREWWPVWSPEQEIAK